MTGNFSLLALVAIPFLGAVISYLIGRRSKNKRDYFADALTILIVLLCILYFGVFLGKANEDFYQERFAWEGFCGLGMHLCMDGFRALYCLIAALMWMMTTIFSKEYLSHYRNRNRYYFFLLMTLGATLGVFLSEDLYTAFIFFEIMSFTSYTWVAHEENKASLRAADTYLAIAVIGGLVLLMGLFILYHELGTLTISALPEAFRQMARPEETGRMSGQYLRVFIAGCCLLFGFGAKAGVVPLHIWLPKAHPVAPAPASALLSGILTKAGLFGILAVSCGIFLFDIRWGSLILVLGVLTMFTGAVLALFSVDLKRTLACSSVSQIGFILVGIGMQGVLGGLEKNAPGSGLAIRGAILHMVNHSLIKLVLFMAAGVVFMNLHKLNLNDIRGFGRKKPFLHAVFLIGAFGIGGVPLLNGYTSKTLLHEAIVECRLILAAGVRPPGLQNSGGLLRFLTGPGWMGAVEWLFLISGGITVAYMAKLYFAIFIEKNKDAAVQAKYDGMKRYMDRQSCFALGGSAVLLPLLGVLPHLVTDKLADMAAGFLHAGGEEEVVAYFSWINLKGACISILIGVVLYMLVVRGWMMRGEKAGKDYVDRWPSHLDLEDLVYRPLLLRVLPTVGGTVSRLCDRLVDGVVVLFRKTIYRDSPIPYELEEGNELTHVTGGVIDAIASYFNHPDATPEEEKEHGKYEHKLAMVHEDLQENGTIIGRSLSFGLFMACLGLLLTLSYMLIE